MKLANTAALTFVAMTVAERRHLDLLSYWLAYPTERQPTDHLTGPEYAALRNHGVITSGDHTPGAGNTLKVTELGHEVIRRALLSKP